MNNQQIEKEIKEVSQKIEEHNYNYYVFSQPTISDKEYDDLLKRLIELEEKYPEFKLATSPSQRIGVKVSANLQTVKHRVKMYSLDNTYSFDELEQWQKRVIKGLPTQEKIEYVVELKIDGVSASLSYENGDFFLGATRGDGELGEDITHSLKTIHSVPLKLKKIDEKPLPKIIDVRAEIYMSHKDFQALNKERKDAGEVVFANARNATSGSLKLLDSRITAKRRLNCFVHSFGILEGSYKIATHWEFLKAAKQFGFCVNPESRLCKTFKEVIDYCEKYQNKRKDIPYDVDGVVIKVNFFKQQNILGTTLKSPRWAVAYKFPAQQATTTVNKIIVQVGRTGVLTPVAELEPVECAGVMISRSSLHNFDEIKRLGIKEGDRVLLQRAGDVIPKIVKVVDSKSIKEGYFKVPLKCPECGGAVTKEKKEDVAYRCINPSCPKQLERALIHFASRLAMNIEGLGEAVVKQLLEKKMVKDLADIYFLKLNDLLTLELFAQKKGENLLKAIEESKTQPLSRFLYGLGIANIGEKGAHTLAHEFGSLDKLMKAKAVQLESIFEIGPTMASSIEQFFKQSMTKKLIVKFKRAGVNLKESKNEILSAKLKGKNFVFTGELKDLTRQEAELLVKKLGGEISSSVSKNTSFVVAGNNPGSKYKKAVQLSVEIINQKQFEEMVNAKI